MTLTDRSIRNTQKAERAARHAYDLYLLRDEAVRDVWLGGPMGLAVEDDKPCVLCEQPMREGPAKGWYARNGDEWMIGHGYCVARAVKWGTAPGRSAWPQSQAEMRVYHDPHRWEGADDRD